MSTKSISRWIQDQTHVTIQWEREGIHHTSVGRIVKEDGTTLWVYLDDAKQVEIIDQSQILNLAGETSPYEEDPPSTSPINDEELRILLQDLHIMDSGELPITDDSWLEEEELFPLHPSDGYLVIQDNQVCVIDYLDVSKFLFSFKRN